jgi:dGTPase
LKKQQRYGIIPNKSEGDIGFERHPLAYLVEAADDICYTIDFEDGINLGLVSEDFALRILD